MARTEGQYSGAAVGWTAFAACALVLNGAFDIIASLTGIINDDFFVRTSNYVPRFDTAIWGWINLVVGCVVLLAGSLYSGGRAPSIGTYSRSPKRRRPDGQGSAS